MERWQIVVIIGVGVITMVISVVDRVVQHRHRRKMLEMIEEERVAMMRDVAKARQQNDRQR